MEIIDNIHEMQSRSEALKMAGHSVALVPTMGFFHEGHLELMRVGKIHADDLVVSIFVNPMQFGPSEDYAEYPRDMDSDLEKAERVGTGIVFCPTAEQMYPDGFQTKIGAEKLSGRLCGISRPGHFDGVLTVVAKLFHITKPHLAIFGQKDYQQLTIISRMVKDLNMDIRIVGVPVVREPDGIAMSSRNSYLSPDERKSALCMKQSLDLAGEMYARGERRVPEMRAALERIILDQPFTEIDYVSFCHPTTLEEVEVIDGETVLALAVMVGKTRLIDNCIIAKGQ
ncbi:MAG: pantoate--beta-alanine ligase [Deltaproteobacteria bacterium]|nr:pantoate--beta-alanine ligase [Deltaproteobacteria bacterium]MBW1941226.1 pantoate--beta-alanine ligase [Deltaproteobacteria bacterium]MBW2206268.1 pantoate--beta-alanine ligase [Deltaproteobacteria bacterium]